MRKFMTLIETITDNLHLNAEIERKLKAHSPDVHAQILDGLEIVMNAGSAGTSIPVWAKAMKSLWPKMKNDDLVRIFKVMLGEFAELFRRNGDVYVWSHLPANHVEEPLDMSDPMIGMAKAQIEYTNMIFDLMKRAQAFSPGEIAADLASDTGIAPSMAGALVQHVIDHSASSVKPNGDGSYYWYEGRPGLTPGEQIAHWKELASRGIDDPTGL
jgi:hypothetical protein